MNWKEYERKRFWPHFKILSRYLPGGTLEDHENLSVVSWSPGRDLNPWEYLDLRGSNRRLTEIDWTMRDLIIHTFHQIILGWSNQRTTRWVGHLAWMGKMRSSYGILFRIPVGYSSLWTLRRRRECNIKMDPIWGHGLDLSMHVSFFSSSGWKPLASACKHGNGLLDSIKGGEFVDQLSDC
jgi:hypothetical protein